MLDNSIKPIKRDVVDEILRYIETDNIIVLHGARQVGKTHILYYLQQYLEAEGKETYFFDLENPTMKDVLDRGIDYFIKYLKSKSSVTEDDIKKGKKLYVFIDEIQYLKSPSPFLKLMIDHHKYLRPVVSGSSSFDIKNKFTNSLVGRTVEFEIFGLSFKEFLRFKEAGNYDLSWPGRPGPLRDEIVEWYKEYVLYGGYPKIVLSEKIEEKERFLYQIMNTYVQKDIRDLAKIKEVDKFNQLVNLLAEQSGQLVNVADLSKICALSKQTVRSYLFILENTYIIRLLPVWSNSAKVRVAKAPKIFFYDTGLLQILWMKKLNGILAGNIFETSVFAELVKKYGRQEIYFWRTPTQTEVDFVTAKRGEIRPFEVKTNFNSFNKKAIISFCKKYKVNDYRVVGLKGEKLDEHCIYPWEL